MKILISLLCFFSCILFVSNAQFCSGSLGDPILNIDFGNSPSPLPPSSTDFVYNRGCPAKAQYTLANLIFGCGDNRSWMMVAGDHTGNAGGHYMFVNPQSSDGASKTANVRKDTVKGLCNNITYVYSAWVTNVMRPISCGGSAIPASVTLKVTTISGTVLGSVDSGNIPIEEDRRWRQYGVAFQLPPGENAVIVTVQTVQNSGCGQGFAIDDITLRPCGPAVSATLNGSAAAVNACSDSKPFELKGTYASGFANPSLQWQRSVDTGKSWIDIPAATSPNLTVAQQPSGVILFRMVAAESGNIGAVQCRFTSNALYTNIHPRPPHHAPQILAGCLGKDLALPGRDPFADSHSWSGPNGFSSATDKVVIPGVSLADTGLYTLQQDYGFGCIGVDSFYLQASPSTTVTVKPEYSICEGQSVLLSASGDGAFSWQPAQGLSDPRVASPVASPRDSTVYQVTVTNSFGCRDSALVAVHVYRNPVANAGPSRTIVKGDSVLLNGSVSGTAIRYYWSPALYITDPSRLGPTVFPTTDMVYTLTAESEVGCGKRTSDVRVTVFKGLFMPNAFSPNNDGRNDRFKIIAADSYRLVKFLVYNRWGQPVYNGTELSQGWDGKYNGVAQPADTYVYFLQIQSVDGETITKKGSVTLIR